MASDQEKRLEELTGKLRFAFGTELVTCVLYGSAAAGDMDNTFSDLNVLCVLRTIGPKQLEHAEPIFHWWRGHGNPSPLLLTEEELFRSADCFPIEFHDIVECHRVLTGDDVVKDLVIDDRNYRAQVEHELRAKLLRLRQKAGGLLSNKAMLLRLMAESVSTFSSLARHALRLKGIAAPQHKREAIRVCAEEFRIDPEPFYTLLDLRKGTKPARELDPPALLSAYMQEIEKLTGAVDRLENR